jgi:hypothetical protein
MAEDAEPTAWFTPSQPAAPGGREVTLRVPEVAGDSITGTSRRVFTGRITRKRDGSPVANASIYFQSKYRDDDGEWGVGVEGSWAHSGADGRFRVVAARAPVYSFSAYDQSGQASRCIAREIWNDDGAAAETIERDVVAE